MKVGFTGTKRGMTAAQHAAVCRLLGELGPSEVHHGCCIGADEQVDGFGCRMVLHPPVDQHAMMQIGNRVTCEPRPFLERNHDIVDATQCLIAAPAQAIEHTRSGTWATVRYARKVGRTVYVVLPDGRVRFESPDLPRRSL